MPRPRHQSGVSIATMQQSMADLRSDYSAANSTRFRRTRTGLPSMGAGADYHYANESKYLKMIEYARDMDRNDMIIGQLIDRAVTNCVQDGFRLKPCTGDETLDADIKAQWSAWATDPDQADLAGEMTFQQLEWYSMRQALVDGDIVALGNEDGPIEMVEGHRVRTPRNTRRNVVHGVLLDDNRRRLQYWVTKQDIDPTRAVSKVGDMLQYDVRDEDGHRQIFHVYNPRRITQTRGVTALAPIIDACGMFEDINFARLVQAQIVSCFAIFRMRELGVTPTDPDPTGAVSTETLSDGSTRTIEGISPGMEIRGAPGEKLEGFTPNVPNPEFFDHMKLVLSIIGVNLGMPLVMVLMDARETNFSGWRGAVNQARMGFRRNQAELMRRFHNPIYAWKLRQWAHDDAAMRRALTRPGGVPCPKWQTPTWPYIEPLKDAKANTERLDSGQANLRQIHDETGGDYDESIRSRLADNVALITDALEGAESINEQFPGAGVTWRDVAGMRSGGGGAAPTQSGVPEDDGEAPDEEDDRNSDQSRSNGATVHHTADLGYARNPLAR